MTQRRRRGKEMGYYGTIVVSPINLPEQVKIVRGMHATNKGGISTNARYCFVDQILRIPLPLTTCKQQ